MSLYEIENLRIHFPTRRGMVEAVRGVTFDINENECVALVGESGCGKSVTARSLMGLTQVTGGSCLPGSEIRYQGENILAFSEKQWRDYRGRSAAMIFQDAMTALNPTMRIGKQIAECYTFHQKISRREAMDRAVEMLREVGIASPEDAARRYPHELSGGMRQRIMIAMALACNPRLIIADEPTTALDVTIQAQILDLLRGLKDKINSSIMLITHDLGVVAEMADYVVVMYAGRVVEKGTAREIFKDPRHPYTIGLMKSKPVVGKYTEKLYSIPGSVPNPIDMPDYCYFKDRCEMCVDGCEGAYPGMYQISPTHFVSCYRCAAEAVGKEGDTKNEQ